MTDRSSTPEESTDSGEVPDKHGEETRRGRLAKAILVLFAVVLVLYTLYERARVLQQLERTARDFQARIQTPYDSSSVSVVLITEEDYETLFESTSPLNPDTLERLIRAIAAGNPRLIAVDLDTEDNSDLRSIEDEIDVPIVWGRALADCESLTPRPPGCDPTNPGILYEHADAGSPGSLFGLAFLKTDSDGIVRRYTRFVDVGDTIPTIPTAVAEAVRGRVGEPTEQEYLIDYRPLPPGNFHSASFVLDAAQSSSFRERGILTDQVVLLGGGYRAARDRYPTPRGEKAGVEILAQVVHTELGVRAESDRKRVLGANAIGLLLLVNGLLLLLVFQLVEFPKAFWVSLALIPVFASVCSRLFTDSWFALWPYVLPLLLAVLVQQLYEHAVRYRNELIERYAEKLPASVRRE